MKITLKKFNLSEIGEGLLLFIDGSIRQGLLEFTISVEDSVG